MISRGPFQSLWFCVTSEHSLHGKLPKNTSETTLVAYASPWKKGWKSRGWGDAYIKNIYVSSHDCKSVLIYFHRKVPFPATPTSPTIIWLLEVPAVIGKQELFTQPAAGQPNVSLHLEDSSGFRMPNEAPKHPWWALGINIYIYFLERGLAKISKWRRHQLETPSSDSR